MPTMALSMRPTGWFQIGWSEQLAVGEVKPMHFFGRELVAYRTESGRLVVLDAYCEHLGAHLGHGGSVHGDDIQCPFHGWRWSPKGRNTCIPYQEATNRARRIPTWSAAERDGVMYLWHDDNRRAPEHDVPSIFDLFPATGGSERFHAAYPDGTFSRDGLRIHPQYVVENGVDFAHFKYVHRADEIPEITRSEFRGHVFESELLMRFTRSGAGGEPEEVEGRVSTHLLGVGLGFSHARGVGDICSLTGVTPVDDETSALWFTAWASREDDDETALAGRLRSAIAQLKADLSIWEHQRYTEPPGLATAEAAGFRDIRRWARQFYPEGHKGAAIEDQLAGTDAVTGPGR